MSPHIAPSEKLAAQGITTREQFLNYLFQLNADIATGIILPGEVDNRIKAANTTVKYLEVMKAEAQLEQSFFKGEK